MRSRLRHVVEAIGLAATLGATSAKAEPMSVDFPDFAQQGILKKVENKPLLEKAIDLVQPDQTAIAGQNKIEGFNPNGLHKPVGDQVKGLSQEINLAEIDAARKVALKLAVAPQSDVEKTNTYVGLKVDL